MHGRSRFKSDVAAVLSALVAIVVPALGAAQLPPCPSTPEVLPVGWAVAINERGAILGTARTSTLYAWGDGKVLRPDGTTTGVVPRQRIPTAFNDADTVVGTIWGEGAQAGFRGPAFRTGPVPLPPISGGSGPPVGIPTAIDRHGNILMNVFYSTAPSEPPEAIARWNEQTQSYVSLPLPWNMKGRTVTARAMNEAGDVVGAVLGGPALRWPANGYSPQVLPLPRSLGTGRQGFTGFASDINDAGEIVGGVTTQGRAHAVVWLPPDYEGTVLGPGRIWAINDHGIAVGDSWMSAPDKRYVRAWDVRAGKQLALLADVEGEGIDINNAGMMIGNLAATSAFKLDTSCAR